jgi:predicted metal-dependent phosphoesterase TrpH
MLIKGVNSLATLAVLAFHALRAFAQEPPLNTSTIHLNFTGVYGPETFYTFQCVPFQVPPGCTSISVVQTYDKQVGNSLDLGLWDQRGFAIYDGRNQSSGNRGWSGGAKSNFTLSAANASTGYIPGSIEPGPWCVGQGPYVVMPGGIHWEVDITLGFDPVDTYYQPFPSVARIGANPNPDGPKWYRGDLHVHSVYSDGKHTPAEVVGFAQQANLNFFVSSEHNTNAGNLFYGEIAPSDLLIIHGIEVTTRAGHWQAIGLGEHDWVEFRYHPGDVPGLPQSKAQVQDTIGGVVQINHPFIFENCAACNWTFNDWDFDTMEVWNGWWDPTDQQAVDKWQSLMVEGNMIGATGGSDFHDFPVVVGTPTTIVRADSQSKDAIVDGIRRHRVIIVDGPRFDLTMCVRAGRGECAEVGDRVVGTGPLQLELGATGMNGSMASVWTEQGMIHQMEVKQAQETLIYALPHGHKWVRVEVRNETTMQGLTNVVFL